MDPNVQDWSPVVLHRKKSAATLAAERQNQPRASPEAIRLAKLANDEPVKQKSLTSESRKDLVAARIALKKSQVDMDRQCAFPQHTFRDIEAGRVTPTGAMLNRINRELKISLRLTD